MKINNFDEQYLEELEQKEINRKLKYKKRDKKVKESFTLQELLTEDQVQRLLKY
ncbi:hypothetical protein ACR77J_08015 [Tissierella praeacuta]|uniref:hypothetical protein n=1 Tax=Tissierella praeacuta TaxID=43131 RepID=UPI003DA32CA7